MKKRSEVAAMKKRSEAASSPKPSAEERTVPLPIEGSMHCDACDEDVSTKDVIRNGDKVECPNCGADIESLATPTKMSTPAGKPEDKFVDPHPDRKWCGDCGTELTIIESGAMKGINFPCGHGAAERVDDPRKAKRVSPAAGLQTRTHIEVDKRNAEDKARNDEPRPGGGSRATVPGTKDSGRETGHLNASPPAPTVTIEGDRISVVWGKSQFPLAMMSNFTVGDFFVSKVLPPGTDRVQAAREILADIEKIADEAFDRQRSWYEKKLGSLQ